MESLSSSYADFILDTRYDQLKPEVIQQAKKLILDLVGISLVGYQTMEFPRMVVQYLAGLGGIPEATIFQSWEVILIWLSVHQPNGRLS